MKILGIDDNADINALFDMALTSSGHEFTSTLSGRHGLTLIRENQFDCILLDLAMPEYGGLDLLNELERQGLVNKQKIIIITASSIVDRDLEFRKKGVSGCLRKPINLDTLLQKIDEITSGREPVLSVLAIEFTRGIDDTDSVYWLNILMPIYCLVPVNENLP